MWVSVDQIFFDCTVPIIVSQPESVSVEEGGIATFRIVASGEGLSYQWFGPDGKPLTDSVRGIEGATTSSVRIIGVGSENAGGYRVRVTSSSGGTVNSDVANLSVAVGK